MTQRQSLCVQKQVFGSDFGAGIVIRLRARSRNVFRYKVLCRNADIQGNDRDLPDPGTKYRGRPVSPKVQWHNTGEKTGGKAVIIKYEI